MEESIKKHLEFIQNIIARMNTNSFLIKGWSITLVAALFALAAKDANLRYVLISYLVIPTFWILDGFFISAERQYRDLYDTIRIGKTTDFAMDVSKFNKGNRTWVCGIFSKTLIPFYGILVLVTILVSFLM